MSTAPRSDPTTSDREPAVRCIELTRQYGRSTGRGDGNTVTALDGVSLAVDPGEVVGLAGPSGSGKSTLIHLLAGLDVPTDGRVELAGTALAELSERQRTRLRLREVGIVFQRFHLLPALSARANVALPLVELGVSRRERRRRASALLEEVGLADRATHRPGELSGGEQQRVAIARALVADPAVLVADEPTGELDTETGERVLSLLADAGDERAVVIASHDERVHDRVDRTIALRDGARVEGWDG